MMCLKPEEKIVSEFDRNFSALHRIFFFEDIQKMLPNAEYLRKTATTKIDKS